MFRIPLILSVFIALICAGTSAAADGSAGQPDGRPVPDAADIHSTTPVVRPDDRGDRVTPGAAPEPAVVTGRPDGRTVPDGVDAARNAFSPVVIGVQGRGTISFDWLSALIGGLAVGGLVLAMGGLLVLRQKGPTPAR